MESMNREVVSDCIFPFVQERISKLLCGWNALQMAVKYEWGGPDSINKSSQLACDIFSWLFHSKGAVVQVEDLENLLHERLLLTFNTEIEDGSIEEVAEQLMIIRDEYLHGNFGQSNNPSNFNPKPKQNLHQNLLQNVAPIKIPGKISYIDYHHHHEHDSNERVESETSIHLEA